MKPTHHQRQEDSTAVTNIVGLLLVAAFTFIVTAAVMNMFLGFTDQLGEPAQAGVTFHYDGTEVEATVVDTGNVHTLRVHGFQDADAVASDSWNATDSSSLRLEDPSVGDSFSFEPGGAAASGSQLSLVGETAERENEITSYEVP